MKLNKIVYWVALTATVFALVGCKKGLQNTTPLPGHGGAKVGEDKPGGPIGIDNGTPVKPERVISNDGVGIPLSGDVNTWPPSSEQPFKADTVYFEFDKSTIKASETAKLDRVANEMKQHYKSKGLRIEGHCDERGTEEYNRSLGSRRALAIREYLVRAGLDPKFVDVVSFGEDRPAVPGHTDAAYAKNRRGEFILLDPPK